MDGKPTVEAFTAAQIIAWAEKQKEYANSVFTAKTPPEAYIQALNHLIHYVSNPVTYIL